MLLFPRMFEKSIYNADTQENIMTQDKTLRQRIRDGEVLVALRGSLNTTKSQLADIWATERYDYIWIDGQHTAFSEESLNTENISKS